MPTATIDVNVPAGSVSGEGCCKCSQEYIPTTLLIFGVISCFAVSLVSVLDLLQFSGVPSIMLDVYMVALSFMAFSAEFRRFRPLRNIIYTWIKFFYFLTSWVGRGLFYIFMGSVLLNTSVLSYIAGGFVIFTGVFMIGSSCKFELPVFQDWQVVKEESEARAKATSEQAFKSPSSSKAATTPGSYEPPTATGPNAI